MHDLLDAIENSNMSLDFFKSFAALLKRNDIEVHQGGEYSASDALAIWKKRKASSAASGKIILFIDDLFASLLKMPDDEIIDAIGISKISDERPLGTLFFKRSSGNYRRNGVFVDRSRMIHGRHDWRRIRSFHNLPATASGPPPL